MNYKLDEISHNESGMMAAMNPYTDTIINGYGVPDPDFVVIRRGFAQRLTGELDGFVRINQLYVFGLTGTEIKYTFLRKENIVSALEEMSAAKGEYMLKAGDVYLCDLELIVILKMLNRKQEDTDEKNAK